MIGYCELSSAVERNPYRDMRTKKYSDIISNINELIDPQQVKLFYPKYIDVEDKNLDIILFLDGKILYGKNIEKKDVEIKIYLFQEIKDIIYKCCYHGEDYFHRLTLKFSNGEVLEFDSMDDAESYSRRRDLENVIKEIAKSII